MSFNLIAIIAVHCPNQFGEGLCQAGRNLARKRLGLTHQVLCQYRKRCSDDERLHPRHVLAVIGQIRLDMSRNKSAYYCLREFASGPSAIESKIGVSRSV